MEEEVNNVNNVNNVKKSGNSGVGTFFFLVVVVAIIIASIICGILEYNYYIEDMRDQINGLQVQIDELKKINNQMDENYRDALAVNVEMEEVEEDTNETADTTDTTDTASTATETTETANVVE